MDDESDDALMERVARDDGRAFAVLVVRHEARLRLYLARLLPSDVDAVVEARDLAQDVFVDVWRARARYQPRGFFLAWLLRMARSRAISRGRALQVRRLFARRASTAGNSPGAAAAVGAGAANAANSANAAHAAAGVDGLETVLAREEAAQVRQALAALPEKTREAVTLRFTYGMEPKEIGAVLGVDAGAVRVRLHRGLALLRARLGDDSVAAVADPAAVPVPVWSKEGVR